MIRIKSNDIKIPFCGFNETEASYILHEILGTQDISKEAYISFATCYVAILIKYIEEHTGLELSLKFKRLDVPDFYDDRDDEIHATISHYDLKRLWERTDKALLGRFKEYASPDIGVLNSGEWLKPVTEWGVLHKGLLLECYMAQHEIENIDYYKLFEEHIEFIRDVLKPNNKESIHEQRT